MDEAEKLAIFKRLPLFAALPPDEIAAIARLAQPRSFERHDVLFAEDDPAPVLYVICSGRIKVMKYGREGNETILNIIGPGDLLGELSLFETGAVRSASAEAIEPTTVLIVRRDEFLTFLRQHPDVAIRLLGTLAEHVRRLSTLVDDAYHLDLEGRLAKRLIDLARLHGQVRGGTVDIAIPLTQADLAGMLGASRESVNKLLRWYVSKGFIAVQRNQIRILQPAALEKRI